MGILSNIEPKEVFQYFEELSMVPRSTFHTKKISDFCVEFAKAHNLEYIQDEMNNVIIKKPGTAMCLILEIPNPTDYMNIVSYYAGDC